MNYGGMALCPTCYDIHNPNLHTVYLMSNEQKERLKEKVWKLEKELRDLKHAIKIDDDIKKSGRDSITYKTPRK